MGDDLIVGENILSTADSILPTISTQILSGSAGPSVVGEYRYGIQVKLLDDTFSKVSWSNYLDVPNTTTAVLFSINIPNNTRHYRVYRQKITSSSIPSSPVVEETRFLEEIIPGLTMSTTLMQFTTPTTIQYSFKDGYDATGVGNVTASWNIQSNLINAEDVPWTVISESQIVNGDDATFKIDEKGNILTMGNLEIGGNISNLAGQPGRISCKALALGDNIQNNQALTGIVTVGCGVDSTFTVPHRVIIMGDDHSGYKPGYAEITLNLSTVNKQILTLAVAYPQPEPELSIAWWATDNTSNTIKVGIHNWGPSDININTEGNDPLASGGFHFRATYLQWDDFIL